MRYNYRGIFDVLTDYAKYDAVEFDTKVWWCKRPVKGRSPADRFNSAVWVPIPDPLATALKSSGASSSYGTEVTYAEILPTETVHVEATEGSSALSANLTGLVPIEVGKKYRVTFDGVAYTCVAFKHASWGAICLGNGRLNGGSTEKTDEPFCINVWASTVASISLVTEGTHTVSVDEIVEEVTPIPKEYLTGETPEPYMQLVTDGEGQAKWEQRLAWKETGKEILWEGDVTTSESQSTEGVYKTASYIQADGYNLLGYDSENPNANLYCEFNGAEIQLPYAGWGGMTSLWGNRYLASPASYEDDGSDVCVEQYTTGNWSGLTFYTREPGTYSIKLYNKAETTHPIPAEYLPAGIGVYDILVKPLGSESTTGSVTFQPVTFSEENPDYATVFNALLSSNCRFLYDKYSDGSEMAVVNVTELSNVSVDSGTVTFSSSVTAYGYYINNGTPMVLELTVYAE